MRISLLFFLISGSAVFAAKPLPQITPANMERIQRLVATIALQEYPCTQAVILQELKDFPFQDLGGGLGSMDVAFHERLAITDPKNAVGYYGITLYFGENESGKEHAPLVASAAVFFRPAYSEQFPYPRQPLVLKVEWPPNIVAIMKRQIRELKIAPSEYVRQLSDIGLPKEELERKIDAVSSRTTSGQGK